MKFLFLRIISLIVSASCMILFAGGVPSHEAFDVADPAACVMNLTVFSDVHVEGNNYPRYKVFANCLRDAKQNKSGSDAFLFLGDNTMNGQNIENMMFHGTLRQLLGDERVIAIPGNHDFGNGEGNFEKIRQRFYDYSDAFFGRKLTEPYFCEVVNGFYFIVLANEVKEVDSMHMSDAQFEWLERMLDEAAQSGLPTFILAHYHPRMAAPINPDSGYSLVQMLADYNREHDVFFLCGHLHMSPCANSFHAWSGFPEAYLPCLTLQNENRENFEETGFGEVVEVYPDRVVFRMRNFFTGDWAKLNGAPLEAVWQLKNPIPAA